MSNVCALIEVFFTKYSVVICLISYCFALLVCILVTFHNFRSPRKLLCVHIRGMMRNIEIKVGMTSI